MSVIFEEHRAQSGHGIAIARLDAPHSLNALSLPMIGSLYAQLSAWQKDPNIACVLLCATDSKAFCAGGDVVQLARACQANPGSIPQAATAFFIQEYQLDYLLYTYTKPLICWGHGYVMGGGMGLLQGAMIRIVTPSSRLSMPEISIGLFPDVGGSRFLGRLPGKLGLFLGLTGAQINAADALYLGLADRCLDDAQQPVLIQALLEINWQSQSIHQLHKALIQLTKSRTTAIAPSVWQERRMQIDRLLDVVDIVEAEHALLALQADSDSLLARAAQSFAQGSRITACLVWEQLKRAQLLSLADVFRMELAISFNCCRHPDFAEGVRAVLIDKDQKPNWQFQSVRDIPDAVISDFFQPPWVGPHPLVDL